MPTNLDSSKNKVLYVPKAETGMYIFGHNKYYVTNTNSLFFVISTTPHKTTIFHPISSFFM